MCLPCFVTPLKEVLEAAPKMPAPTHENAANAAGEAVCGLGIVVDQVEELKRRGANSRIVGAGCVLV